MSTNHKIKEILKFFVGFQTAHTLSHIWVQFSGILPYTFWNFTLTMSLNFWAIITNAAILVALIYFAYY